MTRTKRNTGLKTLQNLKTQALRNMGSAKDAALERAGEARDKTVEAVTQLQKAFEQRVSKAVSRLGIPSTKEVRALAREVSLLKANVEKLRRSRARA